MIYVDVNGRLGKDPEFKKDKNNKDFVRYSLATDDFANGQKLTTWLNITDFTDRGLKIAKSLKKGSAVFVRGSLNVRTYTDAKGATQISMDVLTHNVDFGLSSAKSENADGELSVPTTKTSIEMTCGTLTPPTQVTAALASQSNDDDLPF